MLLNCDSSNSVGKPDIWQSKTALFGAALSAMAAPPSRAWTRNPARSSVNTPIRLEDVAIELSDEEAAMLDRLRLPVYGADDGAALRDILFT